MGRYKSAAKRRREKADRAGALKVAIAAAVLITLVVVYFMAIAGRRSLDEETLCPASPEAITVLLVDVTDPMNLTQRQDFINQLERLRASIPRYGKLAIFKVDATSDRLLTPIIERCNPGTADDVSNWTGDKAATQRRWNSQFEAPLNDAFSRITEASGAERSPILESIQSIALTELKNQGADGKPLRLIVASDLLQNTDRLSFYGGLPTPEDVVAGDAFATLRTDLRNVDVELWMLQRPDAVRSQPAALRRLWEIMISQMGGEVQREYNVSG